MMRFLSLVYTKKEPASFETGSRLFMLVLMY